MPRRSHEKVRTGCKTCRIRRVKCDETRPACKRCVSTGRQCDGYRDVSPSSYSWSQLLCLRQPAIILDRKDVRSLEYFHRAAGPLLAGTLGQAFWTSRVPQVLQQEPVARHAAIAISSLLEEFERPRVHPGRQTRLDLYALQHYNMAIAAVLSDRIADRETLLTLSLLFTCIELLQGNTKAAITHCQHGIHVHNSAGLSSELSALFSHLSIFPLFFCDSVDDFPVPQYGNGAEVSFTTLDQARRAMDSIMARTVRLARVSSQEQFGISRPQATISTTANLQEQQQISQHLEDWWTAFSTLTTRVTADADAARAVRILEMRWLLSRIWTDASLASDEMVYDAYIDKFERLVDIAQQEKAARAVSNAAVPNFQFEMGFLPLLYLAVVKCRRLRHRVRALLLMQELSCSRETLWDAGIMFATGMRFIELEHDLLLEESRILELVSDVANDAELPPDRKRIRDCVTTDDTVITTDDDGNSFVRRKVCFFVPGASGRVLPRWDYTMLRV